MRRGSLAIFSNSDSTVGRSLVGGSFYRCFTSCLTGLGVCARIVARSVFAAALPEGQDVNSRSWRAAEPTDRKSRTSYANPKGPTPRGVRPQGSTPSGSGYGLASVPQVETCGYSRSAPLGPCDRRKKGEKHEC